MKTKNYLVALVVLTLSISAECSDLSGTQYVVSGFNRFTETFMETANCETPINLITTDINYPFPNIPYTRDGSITWAYEDWYGSGGGIAEFLAMPADGSRIYVAWNLNYERISAFEAAGDGTPVWEYDLKEGSTYSIDGWVRTRVSDDGNLLVACVYERFLSGHDNYESVLYRLDPATGNESWPPLIMPPTVYEPENTEHITQLEVAADGSCIAIAARGYRYDPIYEPFHIYVYSPEGILVYAFEIPDPDGDIWYINDIKVTDDGSRMVADFRLRVSPNPVISPVP